MKHTTWTVELAIEKAKAFSSRTEFAKKYRQGLRVLEAAGLLDQVFPKQVFRWNEQSALTEAAKYPTRTEFRRKSGGAYAYTLANGLCLDHLWPLKVERTPDEVLDAAALTCQYRDEFHARFPELVKAARNRGVLALIPPRPDVTLTEAEKKAEKFQSITSLLRADFAAFRVLKAANSPALERIKAKEYRVDVDRALEVAASFETLKEFREARSDLHAILAKRGLVQSLNLKRSKSAFNPETSGFLYVSNIRLSNSTDGILFGITNRHPSARYKVWEQGLMWDGLALHFAEGAEAAAVELELRRRFTDFKVCEGLSPLQSKKGTAGEILTRLCPSMFRSTLLDLAKGHDWSEVWVTP